MNLNGYGKLIKKDRVSGFEKFAFGMVKFQPISFSPSQPAC